MLWHLILFPLFLAWLVCLGSSFTFILERICYQGKQNNDITTTGIGLRGVLGLFFLGIIGVIINFFLPLTSYFLYIAIALLTSLGAFAIIRTKNFISKAELRYFIIFSSIFAFVAGSLNPGPDGGGYHIPHQLWLRNEPIVLGLANLHGRFGFGSLLEYINAPLWLGKNNFLLLSYTQVSFIVFFIMFLIEKLKTSNSNYQVLILAIIGVLVLFFAGIRRLTTGYTYTDMPAGLVFVMAFLYGYSLIYNTRSISRIEWGIFATLAMTSIFFKLSSITLFAWFAFVFLYRIRLKNDAIKEVIIGLIIPAFFVLIWLIKNILSTGCVFYPVSHTCIEPLLWSAEKNALNDSNWVTAWARHPNSGLYSLSDSSWFSRWWFPSYIPLLTRVLEAGFAIGIFYYFLLVRTKISRLEFFNLRFLGTFGFMIIASAFWFIQAPTPRFGVGVFILFFPLIFTFIQVGDQEKYNSYIKPLFAGIVICLCIFSLRVADPWKNLYYQNRINYFSLNTLTEPHENKVKKDAVWGVWPLIKGNCWVVPNCSPYDRKPPKYWGRYMMFETNLNKY